MPQLLISDIDDTAYKVLQECANSHGVSIEDEARNILFKSISSKKSKLEILQRARASRHKTAHKQKTNTLELIREDRDR